MVARAKFEEAGLGPAPDHWVDWEIGGRVSPEPVGWRRSMYAVAEVMFATEEGPPPARRLRWLCEVTEDTLEDIGAKTTFVFRVGCFLVDWLAPLLIGKLSPLQSLDLEDRAAAMEAFEASPLGLALFAVKALLSINYFEHPEVAADIGFDGGCLVTEGGR